MNDARLLGLDWGREQLRGDQEFVRIRFSRRGVELHLTRLHPALGRCELADPHDIEHAILESAAGGKLQRVFDDAARDGLLIDLGMLVGGHESQANPAVSQLQGPAALEPCEAQAVVRLDPELLDFHRG